MSHTCCPAVPAFPVATGPYFLRIGPSCSGTFIQQLSGAEMGSPRASGSVPGQISKLAETYDLFLSSGEAVGSWVNRTACQVSEPGEGGVAGPGWGCNRVGPSEGRQGWGVGSSQMLCLLFDFSFPE